jgi:hypothetical protein
VITIHAYTVKWFAVDSLPHHRSGIAAFRARVATLSHDLATLDISWQPQSAGLPILALRVAKIGQKTTFRLATLR